MDTFAFVSAITAGVGKKNIIYLLRGGALSYVDTGERKDAPSGLSQEGLHLSGTLIVFPTFVVLSSTKYAQY